MVVQVSAAAAPQPQTMEGGSRPAASNALLQHFRGPCVACCKPIGWCCVSADGEKMCKCQPLYVASAPAGKERYHYIMPCCLHMCLCPQQGCDPMLTAFVSRPACLHSNVMWLACSSIGGCVCCLLRANNANFHIDKKWEVDDFEDQIIGWEYCGSAANPGKILVGGKQWIYRKGPFTLKSDVGNTNVSMCVWCCGCPYTVYDNHGSNYQTSQDDLIPAL